MISLIMAKQTLMEALKELRNHNLSSEDLQKIASQINGDVILTGTISNRIAEQINGVTLIPSIITQNKNLISNGGLAIMINKGKQSIFYPLTKILLINVVRQLMDYIENINLHDIFFK